MADNHTNQKKVAIVVHGLNNSMESMDQYKIFLNKQGIKTYNVRLTGHEESWSKLKKPRPKTWVADVEQVYTEAKKENPDAEFIAFGFSLGALTLAVAQLDDSAMKFSRAVYIAPAFSLKTHLNLARPFLFLRFFGVWLPSLTPPEYRLRGITSAQSYYSIFSLQDHFSKLIKSSMETLRETPALVVFREGDELVDINEISELTKKLSPDWQELKFEKRTDKKVHQHLLLDQDSLGSKNWTILLEKIRKFLN